MADISAHPEREAPSKEQKVKSWRHHSTVAYHDISSPKSSPDKTSTSTKNHFKNAHKTWEKSHSSYGNFVSSSNDWDNNVAQAQNSAGDPVPTKSLDAATQLSGPRNKQQSSEIRESQRNIKLNFNIKGNSDRLAEGANDKRGFKSADENMNNLQELQPPSHSSNIISAHSLYDRDTTANAEYQRIRHLFLLRAHHAQLEVEQEGSTMHGKSNDRKRKHHSSSTEPTASSSREILEIPNSPPTPDGIVPQELDDSEDELQKTTVVPVVVHSRRVKRRLEAGGKHHHTEIPARQSLEADTGDTHTINDDSRDVEASANKTNAKKSPWLGRQRFYSEQNSFPDYGPPKDSAATSAKLSRKSNMPSIPGAWKPRNTLSSDPHNATKNDFKLLNNLSKPFNLVNEHAKASDNHSSKRQRREDGSSYGTQASDAHKAVIDLEMKPPRKTITPSARSSQIRGQHRSLNNELSEYRSVNDMVMPKPTRRRHGELSNGQMRKSVGHQHQSNPETKYTVLRHKDVMGANSELSDDPIEDTVEAVSLDPTALPNSPSVVISYDPYVGIANHKPARSRKDSDITLRQTATTSPHWMSKNPDRKRRYTSTSASATEVAQDDDGVESTSSKEVNKIRTKKESNPAYTSARRESNASEHIFAIDQPTMREISDRKKASELLARKQQLNGDSAAKKVGSQVDLSDSYSEDESRKADIVKTNLSRRQKPAKSLDSRFDVIQLCTPRSELLLYGHDKPWKLLQDHTTGLLTFFNSAGQLRGDLSVEAKGFTKVQRWDNDGKLQILKPRNSEFRSEDRIFLELANSGQSMKFCENLKNLKSSPIIIQEPPNHLSNMEKIFNTAQTNREKYKLTRNQEPEDIQIVKRTQKAMIGQKLDAAQASKHEGSRMRNQMEADQPGPARASKRLTPAKRPHSSAVDELDMDSSGSLRPIKALRSIGSNIHSSQTRNSNRELGFRKPTKSRSPSPERWTELHSDWAQNWQSSIIFPKEGRKKATVDKQDIERLDEGQFLNDNLVLFWLLKLEQDLMQRDPKLADRIYFNNTFFYERLTKPVKGKRGINYAAVERWTSRVDLFKYDYIIVPVNEHTHWYLAIIYNAPKLTKMGLDLVELSQTEDMSSEAKSLPASTGIANKLSPIPSPASIPSSSGSVAEPLQKLSLEELSTQQLSDGTSENPLALTEPDGTTDLMACDLLDPREQPRDDDASMAVETPKPAALSKKTRKKSFTPVSRKYNPEDPRIITLDSLGLSHSLTSTNLREYLVAEGKAKKGIDINPPRPFGMSAMNIPQQKNFCDCGLYLLSYAEAFLKDPDGFTRNLLSKTPMEPGHIFKKAPILRNEIRELLFDLQKEQVDEKGEVELARRKSGKGKKVVQTQEPTGVPAALGSKGTLGSIHPSADSESPKSSRSVQPELAKRVSASAPLDLVTKADSQLISPSAEAQPLRRKTKSDGLGIEADPTTASSTAQKAIQVEPEAENASHMQSTSRRSALLNSSKTKPKSTPNLSNKTSAYKLNQTGTSEANAVELEDDSPKKSVYVDQHVAVAEGSTVEQAAPLSSPSPDVNYAQNRQQAPEFHIVKALSPDAHETTSDRDVDMSLLENDETTTSPPLETPARISAPRSQEDKVQVIEDSQKEDYEDVMLLDPIHATSPTRLSPSAVRRKRSNSVRASIEVSSPQRSPAFAVGRDASDLKIIGSSKRSRK